MNCVTFVLQNCHLRRTLTWDYVPSLLMPINMHILHCTWISSNTFHIHIHYGLVADT